MQLVRARVHRMSSSTVDTKAPKGQFRVVGTDYFTWPHEDFLAGDFPTVEEARQRANKLNRQDMSGAQIYDDMGREV